MAQMSFDTLRVESVEERTATATGEMFPVAIISGVSLNISDKTGASSFTKRRVSLPLNGMTLQDAKDAFPIGSVMPKRFVIQQYTVPKYTWLGPDGEELSSKKRYRLVDTTSLPEHNVVESEPESTVEPTASSKAAGPLVHVVFSGAERVNEPQL